DDRLPRLAIRLRLRRQDRVGDRHVRDARRRHPRSDSGPASSATRAAGVGLAWPRSRRSSPVAPPPVATSQALVFQERYAALTGVADSARPGGPPPLPSPPSGVAPPA